MAVSYSNEGCPAGFLPDFTRLTMKQVVAVILLAALALTPLSARGEGDWEITPQSEEAVRRGLDWLATQQNEDGGWGDTPACYSNISTTMLVLAAARAARVDRASRRGGGRGRWSWEGDEQ